MNTNWKTQQDKSLRTSIRDMLGSNLLSVSDCPDTFRSFTQSLTENPGPPLGLLSNVAPPIAPLWGITNKWAD